MFGGTVILDMDDNLRKVRDTIIQLVFVVVVIIGFEYVCFSQIINSATLSVKILFGCVAVVVAGLLLYMYNSQLNSSTFKKVLKNFLSIISVLLTVFNAQFFKGDLDSKLVYVLLPLVLNLIPILSDFFMNCLDLKYELELGQSRKTLEEKRRLEAEMRALEDEKRRLEAAQKMERATQRQLETINDKLDHLLSDR